jgi:hypothetical protein
MREMNSRFGDAHAPIMPLPNPRGQATELRNSAPTRVCRVFDALLLSGAERWAARLLDLVVADCPSPILPPVAPWRDSEMSVIDRAWDSAGHAATMRRWFVANAAESIDPETGRAGRAPGGDDWCASDAPLHPDALIVTPAALILVESRRAEAFLPVDPSWVQVRCSALRQLDAVWATRGRRAVYGLLVVDADVAVHAKAVPALWREVVTATVSPHVSARAIPHRSPPERQAITQGFIGATTWQAIAAEFSLPPSVLMDRSS